MRRSSRALLILATSVAAASPLAADETTHCSAFITSLPYVIATQGHYCLDRNLTVPVTSQFGIRIDADFVWLDLNGFKIGNSTTTRLAEAIVLANHHHNITIRNGLLRHFPAANGTPVTIDGAGDLVTIEDVAIDEAGSGIKLVGTENVVRRCRIENVQNTVAEDAFGVWIQGDDAVVADNIIRDVAAGINGDGIRVTGLHGFVSNNLITGVQGFTGRSDGVFMEDTSDVYRDNVVLATSVPYSGGTSAGGNYP